MVLRVLTSDFIRSIIPENVGTPIMVPITASLYVKGKLATADNVLVDVGTGYFVEKSVPDADDYLKRKVRIA
jgi:prefoldin alpha subunit